MCHKVTQKRGELTADPAAEHAELAGIYVKRGLDAGLAGQVASQLMAGDALTARAKDELGLSETIAARPVQAALTSATTFGAGAALPLLTALVAPAPWLVEAEFGSSPLFIALLGALGTRAGGAGVWKAVMRVTFWGAAAMAVTAGIGAAFGTRL